jgi:hypothetical protein
MDTSSKKPKAGEQVVLISAPAELLSGLPMEDQKAISDVVGKPILLTDYPEDGRAELEFTDSDGIIHFIYVQPTQIKAV